MVTERVESGGGRMIQCEVCGNYYDPSKNYVCPYCSAKRPSLTEVLYGESPSPEKKGHPVTEAADLRSYPGSYGDNSNSYGRGMRNATQIVDRVEPRPVGRTVIADTPGGHAVGGFIPVVGWLIALNGPCKGTDYRLHAGYNYIGRERGDVCLHGDFAISKERDSCINYDRGSRTFYLTHENGINQTLLNDRSVRREAAELYQYDVVTIGQTKLLFMPLCGNRFNW